MKTLQSQNRGIEKQAKAYLNLSSQTILLEYVFPYHFSLCFFFGSLSDFNNITMQNKTKNLILNLINFKKKKKCHGDLFQLPVS